MATGSWTDATPLMQNIWRWSVERSIRGREDEIIKQPHPCRPVEMPRWPGPEAMEPEWRVEALVKMVRGMLGPLVGAAWQSS